MKATERIWAHAIQGGVAVRRHRNRQMWRRRLALWVVNVLAPRMSRLIDPWEYKRFEP